MARRAPKPVVLTILDGWGLRSDKRANAVRLAATPVFDSLIRKYPHTHLKACQEDVGLPAGQCGNSEVGHMNIGAGRVVLQDLRRIDTAIRNGHFQRNASLTDYMRKLKASGGTSHVFGLLSPGGVHSHMDHILCAVETIATAGIPVCVHAVLDGRDSPPLSAKTYLARFEKRIATLDNVHIGTVSGRYYALDRDRRWQRTGAAHHAIVNAKGRRYPLASQAIAASYGISVSDEFVLPCVIGDYAGIADGDGLVVMNFRADRVRQILQSILDPDFSDFTRPRLPLFAGAIGLSEYSLLISRYLDTMFAPDEMKNTLGETLAARGLRQLRITETEKYAHVTYFFNGGIDLSWPGEERILIPSPGVSTYNMCPEMSADTVTAKLIKALRGNTFDFVVLNYANPDMVGHTGSLEATIKAVETVDRNLGEIIPVITDMGGIAIVTADHGNAETMRAEDSDLPHTAHTLSQVPFILAGAQNIQLRPGRLADIAPTILQLMHITPPKEMPSSGLIIGPAKRVDKIA